MARYTGPVCKLCRREGEKLFLKGSRCLTPKCSFERRSYPPGQHGREGQFRRGRASDYLLQLREKQKARRIYGIVERQFGNYFKQATRRSGLTGSNLLIMLESRLDNVVYRLGFANSLTQARQLVRHNHFTVNGKKMNIPSYIVKIGDVVQVREKSRKVQVILDATETVVRRGIPPWLEVEKEELKGTVKAYPTREELTMPIQEQLIVELYSK